MKKFLKLLILLTIATLWMQAFYISAATTKIDSSQNGSNDMTPCSETYVNPLYENFTDISELKTPPENGISAASVSQYYATIEEAGADVREQLKKHAETIDVGIQLNTYDEDNAKSIAKSIMTEAMKHTGNPKEGDYLLWQYGGWRCTISPSSNGSTYNITYTYTMTYYTTSAQEEELDTALSSLLTQLDLDKKTDYEKVKSIYDYICENIVYDNEHLEDDTYKLKFTAYAALINKTAVCQGYATLFYRMSLELGLDARFIAGTGNKSEHGWNIIRLENKYYNLDSTWDAGKSTYDYFLKCNDSFVKHTRNSEYDTEEFNNSYPMGEEDYQPPVTEPSKENPFTDVSESDYFYDAVLWAYENDITTGTDETHFEPFVSCTRAQAVTFLWRANGRPDPQNSENPFTDVNESDYYHDAVLWAYENSITSGTDSTHFHPSDTVTRKEFVTFLWRSFGEPETEIAENSFDDVPDEQFFTKAVLWAYENGITTGSDETHFQPDEKCVRAQIVTFLYRADQL